MLGMKRSTKRKEATRNKTGSWLYVGSEGETGAGDWIYSSSSVAGERIVPMLKGRGMQRKDFGERG